MTESEAKKKAIEILKPVESRLYSSEWRSLMMAIQDELLKATEGAIISAIAAQRKSNSTTPTGWYEVGASGITEDKCLTESVIKSKIK